jgi:hypothetical protein
MANPYPMQQPMGQPQMGGGGGAPPRAQTVKRGTSKAVPVVVSAGLAIGVFCGLLFGLGIEKDEAVAATTTTTAPKAKTEPAEVPAPFKPADPPAATKPPPAKVAAAGTTGTGSAETKPEATPGDKAGSGDTKTEKPGTGSAATPAAPSKLVGKLTITVKPEAIAKTAKIYIDGKQIDSNVFEVDLTDKLDAKKNEARKTVKVLVKASGYKDIERSVDIVAAPNSENNNSFEVDLPKRATPPPGGGTNPGGNTGTTPNRPPPPGGGTKPPSGGNKPKCKKPPCGLIDI